MPESPGNSRQPVQVNVTDVVEATVLGIQRALEVREVASDGAERFNLAGLPGTITMGVIWQPRAGEAVERSE